MLYELVNSIIASMQHLAETILTFFPKNTKDMQRNMYGIRLIPGSNRISGSNLSWGLSMWSLHVLPVYARVSLQVRGWWCVSFLSMWPGDGLATCPGCTLAQ